MVSERPPTYKTRFPMNVPPLLSHRTPRGQTALTLVPRLQEGIDENPEDTSRIQHHDRTHGMVDEPWEKILDDHHETRGFFIRDRLLSARFHDVQLSFLMGTIASGRVFT